MYAYIQSYSGGGDDVAAGSVVLNQSVVTTSAAEMTQRWGRQQQMPCTSPKSAPATDAHMHKPVYVRVRVYVHVY